MMEIQFLVTAVHLTALSKKVISALVLLHLLKILAANFVEMVSELDPQAVMTATLSIRMGIILNISYLNSCRCSSNC